MSQVLEHVRELAEVIGPRPAATDAEANAADYIEDVFRARGLEVERQEFDGGRTTSWAYVLCHALTLAAVALTFWIPIVALVPALVAAVAIGLEMSTRGGFSRLFPKGPSQNIIARHVPRQRRGERMKRVVILAHYDSSKPSLASSPGAVRNYGALVVATLVMTLATPVVVLIAAMPFAADWKPWTGVAAAVVGGGLIVPLAIALHRELFTRASEGASGSAAGVAAMFAVMEATVPEPDEMQVRSLSLRRGTEAVFESQVVAEEAVLDYRPLEGGAFSVAEDMPLEGFGDIDWETGRLAPVSVPGPAPAPPEVAAVPLPAPVMQPAAPVPASASDWADDDDNGPLWTDVEETVRPAALEPERSAASLPPRETRPVSRPAPSPVPVRWDGPPVASLPGDEEAEGQERIAFEPEARPDATAEDGGDDRHGHGLSAWLGIGRGFDVRKAGKKIGSWNNIDDDDEFGFKAGTAGEPAGGGDDEMAGVAARIRRRVTEQVDRALVEKEIWFVATGADEAGLWGTKAFLAAYGDDLADALIINLESVGTGTVGYVTEEGLTRRLRSDRRLVAQAKRTAREEGLAVKGHPYARRETSASAALARGFKAMSVMAFDINGRVPNWRWHTDTSDSVSAATIEQAAQFVTALVRDL